MEIFSTTAKLCLTFKAKSAKTQSWASEGFFPRGTNRGFSQKFFQGKPRAVKFGFYLSKLKKQPFFAHNFKIQGGKTPPSDAHEHSHPITDTWVVKIC